MDEKVSQQEIDDAFLSEIVREHYHAQALSFCRLPSDSGKHIYQVVLATGAYWTLRIVDETGRGTLVELAHLLLFFEQHDHPSERLVFTAEQEPLSSAGDWHFCMTTFLAGAALDATPATFSLLGAAVGRLHALKPLLTYTPPQAEMLPDGELAFARQQLDAIVPLVPRQYMKQYEWLDAAFSSIDHGTNLPTTLIHNDCHPGNALLTAPGQVTFLDWEGAGMGPAAIDLGFLLANCDGKAPWEPLSTTFRPDAARLRAVVEGYAHYHQLNTNELAYLPDAIRFRSLVFGACSFAEAIAQHEPAEFSQWWWARYRAAEEIAEQARRHLERIQQ